MRKIFGKQAASFSPVPKTPSKTPLQANQFKFDQSPSQVLPTQFQESLCKYLAAECALFNAADGKRWNTEPRPSFPNWGPLNLEPSSFASAVAASGYVWDRTSPSSQKVSEETFVRISDMLDAAHLVTLDMGKNAFAEEDKKRSISEQLAWRLAASVLPVKNAAELESAIYIADGPFHGGVELTTPQRRIVEHLMACTAQGNEPDLDQVIHLVAGTNSPVEMTPRQACPDFTESPQVLFLHVRDADAYLQAMKATMPKQNDTAAEAAYRAFLAPLVAMKEELSWRGVLMIPIFSGMTNADVWQKLTGTQDVNLVSLRQYYEAQVGHAAEPQEASAVDSSSSAPTKLSKKARRDLLDMIDSFLDEVEVPKTLFAQTATTTTPLSSEKKKFTDVPATAGNTPTSSAKSAVARSAVGLQRRRALQLRAKPKKFAIVKKPISHRAAVTRPRRQQDPILPANFLTMFDPEVPSPALRRTKRSSAVSTTGRKTAAAPKKQIGSANVTEDHHVINYPATPKTSAKEKIVLATDHAAPKQRRIESLDSASSGASKVNVRALFAAIDALSRKGKHAL